MGGTVGDSWQTKLTMRDEQDIKLRCSRNVQFSIDLPMKNTRSCPVKHCFTGLDTCFEGQDLEFHWTGPFRKLDAPYLTKHPVSAPARGNMWTSWRQSVDREKLKPGTKDSDLGDENEKKVMEEWVRQSVFPRRRPPDHLPGAHVGRCFQRGTGDRGCSDLSGEHSVDKQVGEKDICSLPPRCAENRRDVIALTMDRV